MKGKEISITEAVKKFVNDGSTIAFGGFTQNRHPMSFIREMIRQGKKDLVVYGHSSGIDLDILVGAGAVKRAEIAYVGDEQFVTPSPNFGKAAEEGKLEIQDYSNYGATLRFLAGAMGLPFMPAKTMLGSDMLKSGSDKGKSEKKFHLMECPFTGEKVVLLPAAKPDLAIIHAQMVGEGGTVMIYGQKFADDIIAKAAKEVVVTAEEILPEEQIRQKPALTCLPFFEVDAIVKSPFGAHPTSCYGLYDYDPDHYKIYVKAIKSNSFDEYLERYVYVEHREYFERIGGVEKMERLRADPVLGYSPNLKR